MIDPRSLTPSKRKSRMPVFNVDQVVPVPTMSYYEPIKLGRSSVGESHLQGNQFDPMEQAMNTYRGNQLPSPSYAGSSSGGVVVSGSGKHIPIKGHSGLDPRLSTILAPLLQKYNTSISSGYRPNSKLKTSQHVHGRAADIKWSHLDTNQRRAMIQDLQRGGITGIGAGNNIIHADIGRKRHWTYNSSGKWISGMKREYADLFR